MKVSREFEKLDAIIIELRKENSNLKKANSQLESYVKEVSESMNEEKVNIVQDIDCYFDWWNWSA